MKNWFFIGLLVLTSCAPAASTPAPTSTTANTAIPLIATLPSTAAATAEALATPTVAPPTPTSANTVVPTVAGSPTPHPAAQVVYAYLEARAQTDMALATSLVCTRWQAQAATEVTSFRSMNAKLEGVACTLAGEEGAEVTVSCTGKMLTTYGGETREWDLSSFVYRVVEEEGAWKMCGYE